MKKLIISVLLTIGAVLTANENIVELRAGFSPVPRFEVGAEYRYLFTSNTELGVGVVYQSHGKLKRFTDIDDTLLRVDVSDTKFYDSIPLYATVKYS